MRRFQFAGGQREQVALLVVLLVVTFLTTGLVRLQILDHAELAEQSENNRIRVVPIVPRRGIMYDRHGRRIVDSRPSYTVAVIPSEIVSDVTISNLADLLDMDTTAIRKRIRKNTVSRYQPAPVKRDASFEVIAILEEQSTRFPGVTYQIEQVRRYPTDLGTEPFTGYVGEVSREDLTGPEQSDLRLGSMIGKKGLEHFYDALLRGREGTAYIEVSANGQILGAYQEKDEVAAVPGADLTLTIDLDLQRACNQVLDTFCCGAVVAADPRTGGILAMTSYPSYDANIFSSVIPDTVWQRIAGDSAHPLLNRPVNGLYPPASTVKFVAVGAALNEGLITPHTRLKPCLGGYRFGNRVFHCWERAGHGTLTAAGALERSCDVFLYQLGLKLGVDKLSEYYDLCGFGKPTGIDLPGEAAGLNPDSEYYDKRYGPRGWTQALVLNNAIGQGELLVTPLHLIQFFCALGNDGTAYKLHMIKEMTGPDGSEVVVSPSKALTLPFSAETRQVLWEGLRLVVEGEHGTARGLRNSEYSIGGKTGTAQNPHGENHSWFVGVAPLEAPEIVVCAIVENAGHGSEVAAPVVAQVIKSYLNRTPVEDSAKVAVFERPE